VKRLLAALVCALPGLAGGDAAMKAREGDIHHWIEHYRRERQTQPAAAEKPVQPSGPERAAPRAREKEPKR